MITILSLAVSLSVLWVWFFRSNSVMKDFERFEIETVTMIWVGFCKTSLSTLMFLGVLFLLPKVIIVSTCLMSLFMIVAQYYHYIYKSSIIKRIPSLLLLVACLIIIYLSI